LWLRRLSAEWLPSCSAALLSSAPVAALSHWRHRHHRPNRCYWSHRAYRPYGSYWPARANRPYRGKWHHRANGAYWCKRDYRANRASGQYGG